MLVSLDLARIFAPQLFSVPLDLKMVRVDEKVAPFFDSVFRKEDYEKKDLIIPDPYILRARPLFPDDVSGGPHDILGFRNREIPTAPDVMCIGDSQTYGNNAPLDLNWPSVLAKEIGKSKSVYNMSVGGWCAVEYLEIFKKALLLKPRAGRGRCPRACLSCAGIGNMACPLFRWDKKRVHPQIAPCIQSGYARDPGWMGCHGRGG